jgi:hypothetical protein
VDVFNCLSKKDGRVQEISSRISVSRAMSLNNETVSSFRMVNAMNAWREDISSPLGVRQRLRVPIRAGMIEGSYTCIGLSKVKDRKMKRVYDVCSNDDRWCNTPDERLGGSLIFKTRYHYIKPVQLMDIYASTGP